MAGANIQIELDTEQVLRVLQRASDALDGKGCTLMLEDMGEYLLRATRERAATEHGPHGESWPALDPRYARRKAKKRPGAPMLVWDHHMLGANLSAQVEGGVLYVGTSAKYGAIHQFGGTSDMAPGPAGIPARPWLGVSDADATELVQIVQDHLRAALDR